MVVAGMAVSLSGCDDTAKWFAKPLNPFNNNPGYTYSSLGDARVDRAITANDLVCVRWARSCEAITTERISMRFCAVSFATSWPQRSRFP